MQKVVNLRSLTTEQKVKIGHLAASRKETGYLKISIQTVDPDAEKHDPEFVEKRGAS